ncbi:MAG: response regulator transcription factor [Bryobacteraceae bacterium]|nr:response regulator transcription factor [Bryobacteraceae bacterium]
MRVVLADDEAPARSRLRRQLSSCPDVEIVGDAEDGLSAVDSIVTLQPDLLFLDVQMPGLNGFEVLRALPPDARRPLVIFVTGFDQHALAAFEADAVSYLVKPVQEQRLLQVIDRVRPLLLHAASQASEIERIDKVVRTQALPLRHIVARNRDRFVLLAPASVSFFAISDGLVWAHTPTARTLVNYQLADLESALPPEQFFRASRAALINVAHILEVKPFLKSTFLITMRDGSHTEIQVGERRARFLRQLLPGL